MRRLALLCLIAASFMVVTVSPAEAAFSCRDISHTSETFKTTGEGDDFVRYRWSLRIINQHCESPTTYFDDKKELRVMGEIRVGDPECGNDVFGGWTKYTADVGRLAPRDPAQVEWNCTSSRSWSFTWPFPANDNQYVGTGDRCVGAHVRWVRPRFNDMADDIPQVCF